MPAKGEYSLQRKLYSAIYGAAFLRHLPLGPTQLFCVRTLSPAPSCLTAIHTVMRAGGRARKNMRCAMQCPRPHPYPVREVESGALAAGWIKRWGKVERQQDRDGRVRSECLRNILNRMALEPGLPWRSSYALETVLLPSLFTWRSRVGKKSHGR